MAMKATNQIIIMKFKDGSVSKMRSGVVGIKETWGGKLVGRLRDGRNVEKIGVDTWLLKLS